MGDGAQANIDAGTAMRAIIGGGDIPDELPTDMTFAETIRAAELPEEWVSGGDGYAAYANYAALIVLRIYEKYPMTQGLSDEPEYLRDGDGTIDWTRPIALNVTLYNVVKQLHTDENGPARRCLSALSGFQWGWAVNAARKIVGLGPVPNPALLTISIGKEADG